MATIIDSECWFCIDCGMIIANGDDSGIEDPAAHYAAMERHSSDRGHFVLSGCSEGDPCDFDHECRYDRDFSSVQCDACGTYLAGHRFAGVEFGRPEACPKTGRSASACATATHDDCPDLRPNRI